MVTNITLINWTDQGARSVKDTTKRLEDASKVAEKFGCRFKAVYWTAGAYDMVVVVEGPDEESPIAFGLAAQSLGNIRGQTLRAFSAEEMNRILEKLQ